MASFTSSGYSTFSNSLSKLKSVSESNELKLSNESFSTSELMLSAVEVFDMSLGRPLLRLEKDSLTSSSFFIYSIYEFSFNSGLS